jgi:hypothetical protein
MSKGGVISGGGEQMKRVKEGGSLFGTIKAPSEWFFYDI